MRSMLRSLLVFVLVAGGAGALLAAPVSAGAAVDARTGSTTVLGGPLVAPATDSLLLGEGARAARAARRSSPSAIAQRSASHSKFEGLGDAGTAGETKSAFPELIDQTAGGAPTLAHGQRILRYQTNHAAEVLLANGQRAVVESIAPIATKSGDHRLPLDLHLTDAGADFMPLRSAVAVKLPKDLAEGASLSDLGVSLTPVDSHGSPLVGSQGTLEGASVLWRHSDRTATARDLASVAKPTSTGLELTTMLLSERSPGNLHFRVGMPSGAHLKSASDGSAQIFEGKQLLASIAPVSAEDAEGTSVPVRVSIHGHALEVSLDLDGDYLYPIAVDPEINDSQLAETGAKKPSNWKFLASSGHFEGKATAGEPGILETKGISTYNPAETAYWTYQTQGVSHIYEIKVVDSAHNTGHKVESFLEFIRPGGTKETERKLSNEFLNPEYENKSELAFCSDNPLKEEELDPPACGPTFGKANNLFHFAQAATANPGGNYGFSDSMTQGIVSIAEPSGTHSTTSFNTSSPTLEVEVEGLGGGKEKVKRTNALLNAANTWLSRLGGKEGGAIGLQAQDTGIGVSASKLEWESSEGKWTPLEEHNYLAENGCKGVQCYPTHEEGWTLPKGNLLPDGAQKLRYKAKEAIEGTESLTTETKAKATVKIDTAKPHALSIDGLPFDHELSERPYELTLEATDGEGSTIASSGVKSIAMYIDGGEIPIASGTPSCTTAQGECTASGKWKVNGAELGAGEHGIVVVSFDNAGNEARYEQRVSIRHSTPVALGPGSVDLQSGDFSLGATDVSMGTGLTVARTYSSRATSAGSGGPLGPEWSINLGNTESLVEISRGDVLMTAASGKQTIFASLGSGKFESPPGDSNLELTLEENKTTKEKLAYYLKSPAAHTSVKFARPAGTNEWVPTVQEGTASTDTVTYAYETSPAVTQFSVPGATESNTLTSITSGPDGNMWFAQHLGNKLGKINPTGTVTTYSLPSEALPNRITTGPEGNLWFTEGGKKKVGKITPSGKITEYNTPLSEHTSTGIAAGADGYIWYTESGNGIAKLEPSTGFTWTAKILPLHSEPTELAAGPDKGMWFVDSGTLHKIGEVTAANTVVEYALPAGSNPVDITAGPTGSNTMWFANAGTKKIGTISTLTGEIKEYGPLAEGTPNRLTTGPDGNMWFTAQGHVGKITPSGEISEYEVSPSSIDIAPGPDGKLWYTGLWGSYTGTSQIGTITTSGNYAKPVAVVAPAPPGVSCSYTSSLIEMAPGCRALRIDYSSVSGFEHPYEVAYIAYSPSSKKMEEKVVRWYEFDTLGRLKATWDPRISPALKTKYGYDDEGHITALSPPGQEPWTFTYGAIAGDKGTGRLLKSSRAPASAELWKGEALANTEAPKITGSTTEGVTLAASKGTWSGSPNAYSYQWSRCASAGSCVAIPGATNPNYKLQAADLGDTLLVTVQATNAGGSVSASSAETAVVKASTSFVTEYSVPAGSNPKGITAGPASGTLWFTDYEVSKISKVTSTGTITEYPLAAKTGPVSIVKGPDGNLWYAGYEGDRIGKITTAGTPTEYALPAGSKPYSITSGPDGNLWFTDLSSNKIGKITTSGTITEYSQSGKGPWAIASGSDGNLWFTDSSNSKIGKITTSGTVTEYSLPAESTPRGIAAGPDGNLWFVEQGHKVGKITTSGAITEYSLPTSVTPEYITSANGYLWATSRTSAKLFRVSTSGAIAEFALPAGTKPERTAVNSLGELWYTAASDKLGKLTLSNLADGELKNPEPGITLNYNVPVSGAGAPQNMSPGEVAKWGQSDDPAEATAITAADEPQSWPATSYKRAAIHYLDERGREVNVAAPSTATYGSISTTEYNEFNDVIRTLTPGNRATALAAGASSAERSKQLDTQNTYNGEGKKESEVEEAGTLLIDSLGPEHQIKYHIGGETKEALGRDHTQFVYDQGAPGGETYHLLTEQFELAQLTSGPEIHAEVEPHTTKKSYSGQSNLGWKLRAPTSVTVNPGGLNLTTTTEYNATTGQVTEVRGAGADKTLSYATKFGETGTEAGKLKNPWGVAVNSEGKLWVVDSANNRVEQFSSSGSYVTKFGEAGSANGQFNAPSGIAIDSAGHIWVADTGNNRIQEFSSTGTFMATVGSLGTESGKFKAPAALAFDTKGNMWVADTGNSRIEKFDKEAKYASEFGSLGSEPGKLAEPKGIAIDSEEHVWVADTANNRIQEFSTAGSLLKRFGATGAGEGQLNTPIDLKIDSSGNIWTVDSLNNRAESFSPSGAYITQIGWKGTEPGQLTEPRALAFDATGKAWVTDSSNNRLEQWSKGPNAHDQKIIYYSAAANGEYPACGSHPEWGGLVCETLPAKQPELMGMPKLPVTVTTYNMFNEAETITETFGATTRTKKETYDAAGRKASSEVTASTGVSLPKVKFTYNSELGALEKQTTEGAEEKTLSSEFNRLGQAIKYTDADGNVAKFKYAGLEGDFLLEEASDSSASGTSKQSYEYDSTTKLRTKLIDSAAGSFTASYDAEGRMTSVSYPYGMCANYSYNSVGEATSVSYIKSSNCSETEAGTYYSNTRLSSAHGEMLGQTSTLASESYVYDAVGRLSETQETPAGEGCTVRAYAYDESGNRASSASRTPGVGGACQAEGGTIEGHNYDESGRLADGGMTYDALGNVTKLPAADAEGKELTSTFYVDNAVATQTQGGVTNEYKLDPEGRVRETTTGAVKTKSHYDGPGETPAWTENAEQWVRNIPGIDGALTATQTNGATPVIQLHDLQGNVVGTIGDKAGETKLLSSYNSTEFGVPNAGKAPPKFAWLGAAGVESSFSTGVVTYGSTSYVPQIGRSLQSEQVEAPGQGGGSGLGTPFTMQESPWGMQAAAARGAEAPGLEAQREREAYEAAWAAATDPVEVHYMNKTKARALAAKLWAAKTAAEFASAIDIPTDWIDAAVSLVAGLGIGSVTAWFDETAEMMSKCGNNKWKVVGVKPNICKIQYDVIHAFGATFVDFTTSAKVWVCFDNSGNTCFHEVFAENNEKPCALGGLVCIA